MLEYINPGLKSFFQGKKTVEADIQAETTVCPIFAKPDLDVFAVCSLVPRVNLSHTRQSSLGPKI